MPTEKLRREIARVLAGMGVPDAHVGLDRPRNPEHGDWASNVALTLAKPLGRPPRQIAEEIVGRLDRDAAGLSAVEVAGPGFINFRLSRDYLERGLAEIVSRGADFGSRTRGGGSRSTSSSCPPTPPGRCTSATGDRPRSATPWPS